jgi:hypothetical protein
VPQTDAELYAKEPDFVADPLRMAAGDIGAYPGRQAV